MRTDAQGPPRPSPHALGPTCCAGDAVRVRIGANAKAVAHAPSGHSATISREQLSLGAARNLVPALSRKILGHPSKKRPHQGFSRGKVRRVCGSVLPGPGKVSALLWPSSQTQRSLLGRLWRRPPLCAAAAPSAPRLEKRISHRRVCRNTSGTRHVHTECEARISQTRGGLYHRKPWGVACSLTGTVTSNPPILTPPARMPSLMSSRSDASGLSPRMRIRHSDRTTLAPHPSGSDPRACMGGASAVEGVESRIFQTRT